MEAGAIRGLKEDFGDGRVAPCNLRAPGVADRLAREDQRVLRQVDDQRQTDRDGN